MVNTILGLEEDVLELLLGQLEVYHAINAWHGSCGAVAYHTVLLDVGLAHMAVRVRNWHCGFAEEYGGNAVVESEVKSLVAEETILGCRSAFYCAEDLRRDGPKVARDRRCDEAIWA